MSVVFAVLYYAVLAFFILLFVRLVLDWVQVFARDWRPRGAALVVAEVTYTITDPPIRLLRRLIPPLRLGPVAIDVAFLLVFFACVVLMWLFSGLAQSL